MNKNYPIIQKIDSRQILDSRGNPTIEVEVDIGPCSGRAAVPSGASTGKFEALELRDNNNKRFHGKEVKTAIKIVYKIFVINLLKKHNNFKDKKLILISVYFLICRQLFINNFFY